MRTERQPAGTAVSVFRRVPIATAVALALSQGAMAATFTVTNNFASGAGSLAQAITAANSACSTLGDKSPLIQFSGGPFAIVQSTPLPQFFCTSPGAYTPAIDAVTGTTAVLNTDASGWNATLAVTLDGQNFYGGGCVVEHVDFGGYGGSLTVNGLEIRNFAYGSTGMCGRLKVGGSIVSGVPTGMRAESGSVIGGTATQERNLINGFVGSGIDYDGVTNITNNLIGVAFDGASAYASTGDYGLNWCFCNAPSGTIAGNTIVANYTGIYSGAETLLIVGNRIGMDPTGANSLGGGAYGITLESSYGSTIRDNVIGGFGTAVDLYQGNGVTVEGNKIGTNGAGTAATNSIYDGVSDDSSYGTKITGNTISGAEGTGIYLYGTNATDVSNNLVGANASGTGVLGNSIGLYADSADNFKIDGNLFVGSSDVGIYIYASYGGGAVTGNHIGTNGSGTAALGGNSSGVWLECSEGLTFNNNVIGASTYDALDLWAVQNSVFNGNTIGGLVPNSGHGVYLTAVYCGPLDISPKAAAKSISFFSVNDSDDNQFAGNTIANNAGKGMFIEGGNGNLLFQTVVRGNTLDGVRIDSRYGDDGYGGTIVVSPAIGNSILESPIYGNGGKNINLAFDGGALPNDAGDGDSNKPNNWQNYPDLTDAIFDPINNVTTIAFKVDTFAGGSYRIDFFANPMPGAPGGQTYLGNTFIDVPTTLTGSYSANGQWNNISATATRQVPLDTFPPSYAPGDSSEFSPQAAGTTLPVPGVNIVPGSINFGDVVVGRSSGSSTVTVQSTGTAPYVVNALRDGSCTGPAICSSGAFSCSTTCADGSSWNAGQSCTITASFTPTTLGSQTKTLALCDNAVGSPRAITFSGNGIDAPNVDIAYAPASWSFGEVLVGVQSGSKSFTLTNAGGNVVYLGAATVSNPDFVITGGSCGATLAAGASCVTDVAFSPSTRGGVNASLQIVGSNVAPTSAAALRSKVTTATTNTATALLQASGAQFGELRLPSALSFGTFVLHGELRSQNVELRNTGNGPIAISSLTVSGPFTMTHDCGTSLAAGAFCTITVSFNPATLGPANGALNVVTDASGGSRAIALTASVIADSRPVVRITPTVLGFGNRQIGTDSTAQRVTITNEGSQVANLLPVVTVQPESGGGSAGSKTEFVVTSTCGATLAPQASCFADVVFRALGFGERKGELQVLSNSPDSPQKATLGGTGCRPYVAGVNRSGRDPCQ